MLIGIFFSSIFLYGLYRNRDIIYSTVSGTIERCNRPSKNNLPKPLNTNSLRNKLTHYYTVLKITLQVLLQLLKITLFQYLNQNVKRIGKNEYELSYSINGQLYKMRIVPKRGMKSVLTVIDQDDEDATDNITSYLGPKEDWHHHVYTPNTLGYKRLIFILSNGEEESYMNNEPILLPLSF